VACGVILHIDSYDLHGTGFFDENELESLFYSGSLVVSFSFYGPVVPGVRFRGPQFDTCSLFLRIWLQTSSFFRIKLDYRIENHVNHNCEWMNRVLAEIHDRSWFLEKALELLSGRRVDCPETSVLRGPLRLECCRQRCGLQLIGDRMSDRCANIVVTCTRP
jgi:hypothetical protein